MKYLVIGMLALNLLLFTWLQNQTDSGVYEAKANPLSGERLSLLSERKDITASNKDSVAKIVAEESARGPKVTFIGVTCYSIGPFSSESGAAEAGQTLNSLGLVSEQREEVRRELTGYWVFIPPLPSRAKAKKLAATFKGLGIKDFQIVPSGPKKNAISLGFFRNRDSAEQLSARISALGLSPEKEENHKENSGLWLDFSSPNHPPLPEAIVDALQDQYGDIEMHERNCS